jgi:shikimate dehydrogenase
MMNAAFRQMGLDAEYRASNVKAAELNHAFAKLEEARVSGANVTIPHKTTIARLLDSLDEVSSQTGAVNTIKREGGSYRGYNTDIDGILAPLRSRGLPRIRRAAVLGSGGAARAFCGAMHLLGCTEILVIHRNQSRGAGFLSSMRSAFPEIEMESASTDSIPSWKPELFFNASPVGSKGISLPVQVERLLKSGPTVFDAVYLPVETELIKLAARQGCPIVHGHEMLLHQGLKSLQIWTGEPPPMNTMREVLLETLEVATK